MACIEANKKNIDSLRRQVRPETTMAVPVTTAQSEHVESEKQETAADGE